MWTLKAKKEMLMNLVVAIAKKMKKMISFSDISVVMCLLALPMTFVSRSIAFCLACLADVIPASG
jgi:hypothetical protein